MDARMTGSRQPGHEQLAVLASVLRRSGRQDDQASMVHIVAAAVEALGPCRAEGIFLDGRWLDVVAPDQEPGPGDLPGLVLAAEGGRLELAGSPWAWAYPIPDACGTTGYLVVGAACRPTENEQVLLQILAQQAGSALGNARLRDRQRQQAAELRLASSALQRGREIHDRLTRLARRGEGQDGIALAVHELTGRPAAVEDRFGNLRAWAGADRPVPYPKNDPERREMLLRRVMAARGPLRDGERLVCVAQLAGAPVGLLAVSDPDGTAGDAERVAMEHATTVLAMEVARLQGLVETEMHLRSKLVLDLVAGADQPGILNRAQALGYDLGRPHRVIAVEGRRGQADTDALFHAVSCAAADAQVGSLLAARVRDVIVLADAEVPWERFRASVVAELHGGRCRVGVGGSCRELSDFPRSYREANLALRIQKEVRSREQVTIFDELGVYQVLGTARDTSAMERFVRQWLGALMSYDAIHGTRLVLTLSEYLERGGNYDSSARALSVHRSTLKYRLRRIREVSGHDLGLPDTQFNLQLATRAWRTLRALRDS
jgi:sugar diacid utilization regulator